MEKIQQQNKEEIIAKEIIDLVVARLETIPSNISISIGGDGSFTVSELIEKVKTGDEIGKKMVEMQLAYLRSLSNLRPQQENATSNN
ncbi:hypothetical protein A2333_02520 [Candidatus Wolfebacteria bacterium RIFOXYB2_FULL_49_7]|uniref:Uncharacterized protein n=1 Tax=Candidatus Wolfebacteria bacterium RIFOXYB1_FULL_54_12 TaxID=1802559 RepID=A0A1F8DUY9_9BACT|nr:MAG: hypothetical protein A2372_00040 [Candidatus Wolfebacteria bacterium RIFOXYB1_FULL_54_12]OGM96567.1 MAG: hypothetical protein A2333_02520 [Candidatus Wolfebacteria bacterium RIFOXYB2_FULL_49_7]